MREPPSSKASSTTPEVKRLLGAEGEFGKMLGLPADWAYNIVKLIGNYDEVYTRNLGPNTPLNIARKGSLNASWRDGGLMYPPPFQ